MFNAFRLLFVTELRGLLRARLTIFWTLLFPFFFLVMMMISYGGARGGIGGATTIEMVDLDHSPASERYVAMVQNVFAAGDPVKAAVVPVDPATPIPDDRLRVVIPAEFGKAIAEHRSVPLHIAYNFDGGMAQQVAAKVFSTITIRFNALMAGAPMPVQLEIENSGGVIPVGFAQYMLTGVLIMSMMSSGMNSTCVGIAERRERNTFKMMSCLPMSPTAYLAAMLAARIVVLFTASFVLLFGAHFLFHIGLVLEPERLLNTAALVALGAVMLLALGIAMSSRVSSIPNAIFLCNMVYLSLLFLSNLTMPFNAFPEALRAVLTNLPTAQFAHALRGVLVQGTSLAQEWVSLAVMMGWATLFLVIGRLAFHWHRV